MRPTDTDRVDDNLLSERQKKKKLIGLMTKKEMKMRGTREKKNERRKIEAKNENVKNVNWNVCFDDVHWYAGVKENQNKN